VLPSDLSPYVPGFPCFREGPSLHQVLPCLQADVDLILFDGQGIAHPQGLGLASHLGVLLGKPTIGCAKSRLIGKFDESLLGEEKGSWVPLLHEGRVVGAAVRTRESVRPLYISPGHLLTLQRSIQVILTCSQRFRLPEPLRQVHLRVQRLARKGRGEFTPARWFLFSLLHPFLGTNILLVGDGTARSPILVGVRIRFLSP